MSDHCFCDYDPAEFYNRQTHVARKAHQCSECLREIAPGQNYEKVVGKWDGRMDIFKTCCRCTALREHLAAHVPCFCWAHGSMLDDAREEVANLPPEAYGSGLLFEIGRLAIAIRRAPRQHKVAKIP